jgi:hypothetical protein|tara:strand:+ start:8242 stop:8706 length:465 start_codon:yes stop_codon:yes gene_type:complete
MSFLINSSVAIYRGWFTTYTPFQSTLEFWGTLSDEAVVGIGTVELTTSPQPRSTERNSLTLHDVLHVSTLSCNAFGQPILKGGAYTVMFGEYGAAKGGVTEASGRMVAYFDHESPAFGLKVFEPTGRVLGPSMLGHGGFWLNDCHWSAGERARW